MKSKVTETKRLFVDQNKRVWQIEKMLLPRKKGVYIFYAAECLSNKKLEIRENKLSEIKKSILQCP